jgi:hypothetical protein
VAEWWLSDTGDNMLKGVEDDVLNPYRLSDDTIQEFLRRIPEARASFERLFPTLLLEEQERLSPLYGYASHNPVRDPTTTSDSFQRSQNTAGIHTTGPKGGGSGW